MKYAFILLVLSLAAALHAADAVTPGELVVEPSTLHCLGFEWPITGDDNRNAAVAVAYRAAGTSEWRNAQPLLRIGGEKVAGVAGWTPYVTPHMFAGSIFNLDPGAAYEVRLTMSDSDGGEATKTAMVSTKALPSWIKGSDIDVRPGDDLAAKFRTAKPGDHVVLHAGVYKGQFDLSNHSGEAGKPIVIRAAGDGDAIIEGTRTEWMINIVNSHWLWFEGLTFRDPGNGDGGHTKEGVVLLAGNSSHGYKPGAKNLVVRHCTFEDFGVGVMAADMGCDGYVITDNRFLGRQDWRGPKEMENNDYSKHSYVAAWMNGSGHDVAYNYVRGFRDGINVESDIPKTGDKSKGPRAIDFYNNIITEMGDDFFEADNGVHNIRIMRNLCLNTQTCGLSAQPVYGGPAYFIGNILYNGPRGVALKFNVQPAGLIVQHNTFVIPWKNGAEWSNGHFRNNLFVEAVNCRTLTDYSTFDYNGYGSTIMFQLKPYADAAAFSAATGHEKHGRSIADAYSLFVNVAPAKGLDQTYKVEDLDFHLKPGSAAVDAAVALPNENDGFKGAAPDLGALELQGQSPHFGPRPRTQP